MTCKKLVILIFFEYYFHCFVNFSDVGDSPTEPGTEDIDSEVYPSEDGKFYQILNEFLYLICYFIYFRI